MSEGTEKTLQERRAERARRGSKRRRDLEALEAIDGPGAAAATEPHERIPPLPADVRATEASAQAWDEVRGALRERLPDSTCRLWIEPLELVGEADGALCLRGRRHIAAWARRRYGELLGNLVRERTNYRGVFVAEAGDTEAEEDACL